MKQRTPILKKRKTPRVIHSERTGGHKRVRLYGAAKSARRRELFERSGGNCEDKLPTLEVFGFTLPAVRCFMPITWESMEWSHNRHGANKCDCLECGIASCSECHRRRHNPKPNPRKPVTEAK